MENRLQELTSKIYQEGIAKASAEAEKIIADANKTADELRNNAKKEASQILEKAGKEAQELKKNVESEVKLSARQAISTIKQQITGLVTSKATGESVKEAFKDKDFVKKIIETTIKNWNPGKEVYDLQLLLPKEDEKTLGEYFSKKQVELMKGSLEVKFDDRMDAGFKIGPKDGRFIISFTEEDFENFFRNYLRPRTTQLLYGGE
jgi:V/A-type H+/Na+-transporting ATPase subunit E